MSAAFHQPRIVRVRIDNTSGDSDTLVVDGRRTPLTRDLEPGVDLPSGNGQYL